MPKRGNISLSSYDDIFRTDESRAEEALEKVQPVAIDKLVPFKNHPFKVVDDEAMLRTTESIAQYGVLTPLIARPLEDGTFEIISGHRRAHAALAAGLTEVPVLVRQMDDDAATVLMVDSNLQRTTILPSEKAFAYKMRLDAMRRTAGRPRIENGVPVGHHLSGKAREILAENVPDSNTQIQRYIRLTNLIPGLLELVDEGRIALRPAVEISYLTVNEQKDLLETISYEDATPSLAQAIKMREFSTNGRLSEDVILSILSEQKPNQREKISFQADRLRKYIPSSISAKDTESYVLRALEHYQKVWEKQQRKAGDAR